MTGMRVAVATAFVLVLVAAASWVILAEPESAQSVDVHSSNTALHPAVDALDPFQTGAEALKAEAADAPAVLETVGRGRLGLSRSGECGEVPGVVLVLRNLGNGNTHRTFGRFSKWEWRDVRSGAYEVSLDPEFSALWSCEPQVFHVARDERASATVELRSTTRIAGWIGDGFDSAVLSNPG